MKIFPILSFLLLATLSCTSPKSIKYNFPNNISTIAHTKKDVSKNCIQSKGYKLIEKHKSLTIIVRNGEKKFNSGWGWKSPEWNGMWVLGLTHTDNNGNYKIEIATNPNNPNEISESALEHEFGHFWLMSNFNDISHNPIYKNCFWNWKEPNVKSMLVKKENEIVIVDFIINSNPIMEKK